MTNFLLIDPVSKSLQNFACETYKDALRAVGLDPGAVDHGTIGQSQNKTYHIWVYEYGLMTPRTDRYFALNKNLYNGPAVIYCAAGEADPIDVNPELANHLIPSGHLIWLDGIDAVEAAIQAGKVRRPYSSINGEVFWEWNRSQTSQPTSPETT